MRMLLVMMVLSATTLIFSSFIPGEVLKPPSITVEDSLDNERQRFALEVLETVKGREDMQASEVYKNLKTFHGKESIKTTHFIEVMKYWGEALGVSCTHCHNTGNWASDEKIAKQIARDMYALRQTVNGQILQKIKGLQTAVPMINCATCHRGKLIPDE